MRAAGFEQPRPVGRALRRQFDPSGGPGRVPAVRPALRTGSGAGDPLRLADRAGRECARRDVACPLSGRRSSPIRHPALAQGGPARFRGALPDKRSKSPAARVAGPHKHRPPAYVVDGAADRRDLLRFPGPGELSVVQKSPERIACPRPWLDKRPGGAYVAGADDGGGLCCVVHLVAGGAQPLTPGQRRRPAPTATGATRTARLHGPRAPPGVPLTQTGGSSHRGGAPPPRAVNV